MLLNYLCVRIGASYISDLKYSDAWQDILLMIHQEPDICRKFSIEDWQEALAYLKNEQLHSNNYEDYLKRLLT